MPFFAGLASGFNQALEEDRQLSAREAEARAGRENSVLTHLASEHPDPEVRAQALLGLTDQRSGRSKGWKGFMNGYDQHPSLPKLRALISGEGGAPAQPGGQPTGQPGAVPPGAPGAPASTAVEAPAAPAQPTQPTPATVGPAGPAQPATTALPAAATGQIGPTSAGPAAAPPPAPQIAAATPPPGPGAPTPQRGGGYLDPNEAARRKAAAAAGGAIQGRMDAVSPYLSGEQRRTAALGMAGVHIPMTGQFMGNNKKPDGTWVRQERYFDQSTGSWQMAEVPIATPTGLQVKPTYQHLAGPDGRPHVFRVMPDGTKDDLGEQAVRDGYITGTDPATGEQYSIPAPAVFERPRGAGAAGAAPQAAAPPPGAAGAAPGVVAGAGGTAPAGTAAPGAATPPPGPGSAPATGGKPAGAIGRGRAKALKETSGAFLGPDGQPQVGTALYDDKLGKYYDPRDPTKEIAGFIPGKDAAEAVKVIAQTTTIESTIDRAIAAIKDQGLENDTDPNTTAKMAAKYQSGTGDDPLATATQALTNFTKIQAGSAYMQGTRSFQYVKQIQDHLPVSPGVRAAAANRVSGGLIGPKSTVSRLIGGPDMSWDSPKQMIEKLLQAKASLAQVRQGFTQATGKVPERQTRGGAAPQAPTPGAPGSFDGKSVGPGETHPDGTEGQINGQPAVWLVNGPKGPGWYGKPPATPAAVK